MRVGKRIDIVKAHFEGEASAFDSQIANMVPHYETMLEALVSAIPFPAKADIDVLDLGSGTGNVSWALRKRFPNARMSCIDISEKMLDMARGKLGDEKTEYILADFSRCELGSKRDAVVSSLALHHLEKKDRRQFFTKIYEGLNDGGVFINADIVLASNARWQRMYLAAWKDFLAPQLSEGRIKELYRRYRREDRPVPLLDDIQLLRETNFREADVLWKHYNFAVYGALK